MLNDTLFAADIVARIPHMVRDSRENNEQLIKNLLRDHGHNRFEPIKIETLTVSKDNRLTVKQELTARFAVALIERNQDISPEAIANLAARIAEQVIQRT